MCIYDQPRGRCATGYLCRLLPACLSAVIALSACSGDARDQRDAETGVSLPAIAVAMDGDGGAMPAAEALPSEVAAVEFRDGRLSVALEAMPLQRVITEVSRQTGVEIRFVGLAPVHPVSQRFSDSALEPGLRRLFDGFSTVFIYGGGGKADSGERLDSVLILPAGEGVDTAVTTIDTGDIASRISALIQATTVPTLLQDAGSGSVNDTYSDQALHELAESLRQQILIPAQQSSD